MADEALRTMVRELRTSVSEDLSATHRQMAELSDEVRARITTAETAILHAVRDMGRDIDRRLTTVGGRLSDSEGRLAQIDDRLTQTDARLTQIDDRLTQTDARLTQIDDRLTQTDTRLERIEARLREA